MFRGHLRTNAAGANLNREWAAPSAEESPEVHRMVLRCPVLCCAVLCRAVPLSLASLASPQTSAGAAGAAGGDRVCLSGVPACDPWGPHMQFCIVLLFSQVLLVLREMEEVGCDLLVDVHGKWTAQRCWGPCWSVGHTYLW